ncbi:hypothetical protein MPH_04788 [Macrophomina phaseolina MS6]|uniref:Rad21/Rec8-like protein C-terminal eukaryotic domain-containing protein n=1 Tax=Macrophomina phaseolina (strain MS6) TaxID=1126212 RepID=K2SMJ7_MACPH|nr:hypothetical protein MPH_04788 [Macrophomina phaseolina MS6]
MLKDDPNFLPDFTLAPLDLDDIDLVPPPLTRSSSLSSLCSPQSPHRCITTEEQEGGPLFGLNFPSSGSGGFSAIGDFVVPGDEGPGTKVPGGVAFDDEGFEPGVDFEFDIEGNMIEHVSADELRRTPSTVAKPGLPSSSAMSAKARQEHEEARQFGGEYDDKMDIDISLGDEDEVDLLPEAQPFPSVLGQPVSSPLNPRLSEETVGSSPVIQAPVGRQRKKRSINMDERMELRNADLAMWMKSYLDNMREAGKKQCNSRINAQARKNAEYWVIGMGIGGVGAISGNTGLAGPLDMFSGDALLLSLGIDRNADKNKRKRKREAQDTMGDEDRSDEDGRRVHQRSDEENEAGGGDVEMDEEFIPSVEGEQEVELPREAEAEKEERDLSQMFPWNVTASVRDSSLAPSARRALGFGGSGISSTGGPSSLAGRAAFPGRRSRIISESPLHGRGQHDNLEEVLSSEPGDLREDTIGGIGGDISIGADDEEFELYGPAAAIDTQTANESHFARTVFAKEMEHFGMFVFDSLKRKEEAAAAERGETGGGKEILFKDALPPDSTTRIVAAQGFMHLLALASLGRVTARQDEPFAEIGMSLPHAVEAEAKAEAVQ